MKYSFSLIYWSRTKEPPLEKVLQRISNLGYDGVELIGHPDTFNTEEVRESINANDLETSAICAYHYRGELYTIISPDEKKRKKAIAYINELSKMANDFNSKTVILTPFSGFRTTPSESSPEKEWKWAVDGLKICGKVANDLDVKLAIEPLNKLITPFANRLDQGVKLVKDIGLDNIGIMADTWHMNMEETDMARAIINAGENIIYFHVSDSNRGAAGWGHIDFKSIFRALKVIGYNDWLTSEVSGKTLGEQLRSIMYVKELWEKNI